MSDSKQNADYEAIEHAARIVRTKLNDEPRVGVVLGSGLGGFADELAKEDGAAVFNYDEIDGFALSTVEGHAGRLVVGKVADVSVVCQQGRVHFYEGYDLSEVTFPVRVLAALGIKTLILTNAAGGINESLAAGDLMIIEDHLNLMSVNPLRGVNDERLGARFPDMTTVYDVELRNVVTEEAAKLNLEIKRGVYAAFAGPSYETPAEIRMLRSFGADAVGMSTVPEAIVARHAGLRVLGISCITNAAAGVSDAEINHAEVMETGARVRQSFVGLLRNVIARM